MMKTIFFDLETTGVDFDNSAVIQIGAILDINGKEVASANIKIRPHEGAVIDPGALKVTGLTKDELYDDPERLTPLEAYWRFMEMWGFKRGAFVRQADRVQLAGYNSLAFDNRFLQALGRRAGDNYTYAKYHWPGIDVASIACAGLRSCRGFMKDFKLMTVAKELGVNVDGQAHDALFDVHVTRELYYKILEGRL